MADLMRGMVYHRSEDASGWSHHLIKLIITNDIQSYNGHREIKGRLKEDYSIYGYSPSKYDIFVPELKTTDTQYWGYYSTSYLNDYFPIVLESVSDDVLTFKPPFDLDVNVLIPAGTYEGSALVSKGIEVVLNSVFGGVTFLNTISTTLENSVSVTYDNITTTTMADIWESVYSQLAISNNYVPYWFISMPSDGTMTITAGMIGLKTMPIKLETNQILDVDQTTNMDSTTGTNIVGGYTSDGAIYKYVWLNDNHEVTYSTGYPNVVDIHTALIVKYVQIDSADDTTLLEKTISEIERTISSPAIEIDLKVGMFDVLTNSLQVGGWAYLIGYLENKPILVQLREFDFVASECIFGANSNLSLMD